MVDFPDDFPRKTNTKKIKKLISEEIKETMAQPTSHRTSQAGSTRLFKLGRINLGLNEIYKRQNRTVTIISLLFTFISLIFVISAFLISRSNSRINEDWKNKQLEILEEIKIQNQLKGTELETNLDSINNTNSEN